MNVITPTLLNEPPYTGTKPLISRGTSDNKCKSVELSTSYPQFVNVNFSVKSRTARRLRSLTVSELIRLRNYNSISVFTRIETDRRFSSIIEKIGLMENSIQLQSGVIEQALA
jgi:hypothetical protein